MRRPSQAEQALQWPAGWTQPLSPLRQGTSLWPRCRPRECLPVSAVSPATLGRMGTGAEKAGCGVSSGVSEGMQWGVSNRRLSISNGAASFLRGDLVHWRPCVVCHIKKKKKSVCFKSHVGAKEIPWGLFPESFANMLTKILAVTKL